LKTPLLLTLSRPQVMLPRALIRLTLSIWVSPTLVGLFQRCVQDCSSAWLQDSSNVQALSSAGYDTAQAQQLLKQSMSAWQSTQTAAGSNVHIAL
jgi:hypothetical protein